MAGERAGKCLSCAKCSCHPFQRKNTAGGLSQRGGIFPYYRKEEGGGGGGVSFVTNLSSVGEPIPERSKAESPLS